MVAMNAISLLLAARLLKAFNIRRRVKTLLGNLSIPC
jgi:hypothetical protein